MGVRFICVLKEDVAGADVDSMEGKCLCAAYCGGKSDGPGPARISSKVIAIDFARAAPAPTAGSLLAPLDEFINAEPGSGGWHDSKEGLAAVRAILSRLRAGKIRLKPLPEFNFPDSDDEFTEGVIADLEELEIILVAASGPGTVFCLEFDL